jgi:amino acid permease
MSKSPSEKSIVAGERQGTAGFGSSSVNLLKSIMGSGMLALPAAVASVGAVPGLLLLAFAAILSVTGLQLLVLASNRVISLNLGPSRNVNFGVLATPTYPRASFLFEGAVVIKCTLVAASYLTVVRDVLPTIISGLFKSPWPIFTSTYFWVTLTAGLIAPVTFMHRMNSLKYTSFLGLLGIAYLLVLSMILFFGYNSSVGESLANIRPFVPFTFGSLSNFSVFVFAFTCHQNVEISFVLAKFL